MKVVGSISLITPNVTWSERKSENFSLELFFCIQLLIKCTELPIHRTLFENFGHFNIYMYKFAIPTQNVLNLHLLCSCVK